MDSKRNLYLNVYIMIIMDFACYDNIYTFNKRVPFNGNLITRIPVIQVEIPETGAFWFETNFQREETNVNMQKPYVHFHPGMVHMKQMQFDKQPHMVRIGEMKYNPKTGSIEIKKSKSFWRKEKILSKKCVYYGSDKPKKEIIILGEIYYDMGMDTMNFILNYFPQYKRKITFENEPEPPTFEQIAKVELLEEQIKEAEEKINKQKLSV